MLAHARFCFIFRTVAFDRMMALRTSSGSDFIRTIFAASIATSVPAPIGDADVGLGQGGCVVYAVAHHRHEFALPLKRLDVLGFVLRETSTPRPERRKSCPYLQAQRIAGPSAASWARDKPCRNASASGRLSG